MSAPVFWIFLPAIVSVILFFTKQERTRYFFFVAASMFFVLSTFIIRIDPSGAVSFFEVAISSEMRILGRSFVLTEEDQLLVQIVYFINALWGIFSYFSRRYSRVVPLGLLFSAMLLAAYAVTPFLYAALIIELAIILSVPLLHDDQHPETRGISRYMIYQTLALPFILLAGWFLAGGEISPVNPAQLVQATLLLGLGFILWLGIFPFHSWISLLYRESETINLGYILQLLIFVAFLIMLKFIDGFSWLRQYSIFFEALLILGAIMEGLGSLGLFFQKNLKGINGYALMHMTGMLMTTLGIYLYGNISILPYMFANFFIALSMLHITIEYIVNGEQSTNLVVLQKNEIHSPALIGYVYALLIISGMPLTIGFAPVQWVYQTLAAHHSIAFWVLIGSKTLISITAIRLLKWIYEKPMSLKMMIPKTIKDWALVILLIFIVLAGLFPGFIFRIFDQLITGFKNLIQ